MQTIFIFLVSLQCMMSLEMVPNDSMSDEINKYVDLSVDESENNSSVEELEITTESFKNTPSSTLATLTFKDGLMESSRDSEEKETEQPLDMMFGSSEIQAQDPIEAFKKSKSIKERLLDSESSDSSERSQFDETPEIFVEDTTVSDLDSENNETNIEDPTTIIPLTSKKPKNLEIYKTRPNILLRHYVEDSHLRSPIAALIDKKPNPLAKSKKLWKAALKPNSLLDIMVVSFDSEGIRSTYNLTNTKTMISTLDRVREENVTTQESKTYYSIIRTGQLIPYDSAIFLSTDNLPNDTEHQQPASMILLKKRIRLYLVIFDEKNHVFNETSKTTVRKTGFLGQLALRTGGDIIYVPNYAFRPDGNMESVTLIIGNMAKWKPWDSEIQEVKENELKNENIDLALENLKITSA